MKVKMAMSQKWKEESCPASVETEEFEQYLSNLYGAQKYTQNDNIAYVEGAGWDNCSYKKQADQIIDKLVLLSGIEHFRELKNKFNLSTSPGKTRDNLELIKSTAELLCYQLEEKKVEITPNFRNKAEFSTLNDCVPGAANNMQQILDELQHSNYYDKLGFIEAMLTERFLKIFPNIKVSMEIHKNEEVKWVLHNDYKIQYNNQDPHASFFNTNPNYYTRHLRFKKELDELFESREGVYKYVDYLTQKIIRDLPANNSFYYDQNTTEKQYLPSEEFERISTLATELNISIRNLIEDTDENISKNCKIHYLKNYEGIIKAALMDRLQQEGMIDFKPMTIGINNQYRVIETDDGWYLSNGLIKILDYSNEYKNLTFAGQNIKDYMQGDFYNMLYSMKLGSVEDFDRCASMIFFGMIEGSLDTYNQKYRFLENCILYSDQGKELLKYFEPYLILNNREYVGSGNDLFKIALNSNNSEIVAILIKNGAYIDAKDVNGDTALLWAIRNNKLDMISALIENGAIETKDINLDTALLWAIKNNKLDMISALIKNGADIGAKDINGDTALLWAVKNNKLDMLNELIAQGANINIQDNTGRTALMYVISINHLDIVNELIAQGANINIQDNEGRTALRYAIRNNKSDIIDLLIEKGANIGVKDNEGCTILMHAVQNCSFYIVEKLISAGADIADINIQDNEGNTALIYAVQKGSFYVVKELISAGANVNIQNNGGDTALIYAVQKGSFYVVKELISAGADINIQDNEGKTALMYTILYDCHGANLYVVNELIAYKELDINAKDNDGWTALIYAAKFNKLEILTTLITKGANIDEQDVNGNTALFWAIKGGATEIVKELLDRGADLDKVVDIDTKNLNQEIISLLAEYRNNPVDYLIKVHKNNPAILLEAISNLNKIKSPDWLTPKDKLSIREFLDHIEKRDNEEIAMTNLERIQKSRHIKNSNNDLLSFLYESSDLRRNISNHESCLNEHKVSETSNDKNNVDHHRSRVENNLNTKSTGSHYSIKEGW